MAYFDELMQRALTVRNNVAPSSNTAILVGGVLVSIVSALQLLLDTKQGTLTFDDEPTDGSTNGYCFSNSSGTSRGATSGWL